MCFCILFIHFFLATSVLSHSVMSDSLRSHGLQPTRLLCPWDFPGKNIGMGSHALLQGTFLTQESNLCLLRLPELAGKFFTSSATWEALSKCVLVAQSCLTLCNTMDCSPPGSSVHGIFQARILEGVAMQSARGSS